MNRDRRIFVACYAASGAAALVYQVAWTRLFSLQLGHTTAASSTVLAAFMGGMAVGAWIGGSVRTDSGRRLLLLYAAIELFIAAIAVVLPAALHALVPALAWAYADGATPTLFAICARRDKSRAGGASGRRNGGDVPYRSRLARAHD